MRRRLGGDAPVVTHRLQPAGSPGNHAATIIELVSCPVLVVPPGCRSLPNCLVFTAYFDRLALNVLPRLAALEGAFPAPLELVQFYAPAERPQRRRLKQAIKKAAAQLTWPLITPHLLEDNAPLEATSEFCTRTQTQLLGYFDARYATTRAYHTQLPVLVLRFTERQASVACCEWCAERLAGPPKTSLLSHCHNVRWV